jgi:hypothetical protein
VKLQWCRSSSCYLMLSRRRGRSDTSVREGRRKGWSRRDEPCWDFEGLRRRVEGQHGRGRRTRRGTRRSGTTVDRYSRNCSLKEGDQRSNSTKRRKPCPGSKARSERRSLAVVADGRRERKTMSRLSIRQHRSQRKRKSTPSGSGRTDGGRNPFLFLFPLLLSLQLLQPLLR